jgi:hypothetical protein
MKETVPKYYYLFRGAWLQRLDEVVAVITDEQPFDIWKPADYTKELHLLVVYGGPLPSVYCLGKHIWSTTEEIVSTFYYKREIDFTIHKYQNLNQQPLKKTG